MLKISGFNRFLSNRPLQPIGTAIKGEYPPPSISFLSYTYFNPVLYVIEPSVCVRLCVCVFVAIQVSGSEYVEHNGPIQLMCNATGRPDPPHNVDWFKDGQIVHSDVQRGLIVTKKIETRLLVSVLSIRSARLSDAGHYECLSSENESAGISVHVLSGMW